jgi:hypothetical protein
MSPKTLWNIRKKVTDQELDTVLFHQVTEKLARVFQVDPSKQRLDSVHSKSNMRCLGRLGLLAKCIRITGRDLRNTEIALKFDDQTISWEVKEQGEEDNMTPERQEIVKLL